ncbi:spore coat protein I [Oxobacter pfennigii]|uniref:Spore coat protein I n=1 Tax=Oxobacter pfennigii TaxID=36849 RepID=A0A0P8YXR5_9CLOT|nr:CotS family spore coat protein [Oxobacter pfennigii]KPU44554.1 spore coat protein I [Oxobacter pfennigii]
MQEHRTADIRDYLSLKYDININFITPVKNVLRINTESGDKCLKRVKYGKGHFLFILSAMNHLLEQGFESIIPFIPTNKGELFIEYEGYYYFLTDWIKSRECNYQNPVELRLAAVTLSKLHNASLDYKPVKNAEPRIYWGKWVEKFMARMDEMLSFRKIITAKPNHTYFDKMYLEYFDYFYSQGASAIEHLKKSKYLELSKKESMKKGFCHHDYAHHNVLITDDLKAFIIDFDYCICDTRIHDLSSLIIRNMKHGNWNIERAQYIIDCYSRYGYLEEEEIPVINAFMEFPQDFWQVGLQYYVEKQRWEENNFNKRLDNVITDKIERQQFLDEFKDSIEI